MEDGAEGKRADLSVNHGSRARARFVVGGSDSKAEAAKRITRGTCPYCGGPRVCSALARSENPFCAACLHQRMREAKRDE